MAGHQHYIGFKYPRYKKSDIVLMISLPCRFANMKKREDLIWVEPQASQSSIFKVWLNTIKARKDLATTGLREGHFEKFRFTDLDASTHYGRFYGLDVRMVTCIPTFTTYSHFCFIQKGLKRSHVAFSERSYPVFFWRIQRNHWNRSVETQGD